MRIAMTTSSSAVFAGALAQGRSRCIRPAWPPLRTASMASAVAMPRSLWVCTEMVTSSMPSTRSRRSRIRLAERPWHVVARRVGDVHDRGARLHRGLDDPHEEILIRAAGIFGIELDVVHEVAGKLHGMDGALDCLVFRETQLVAQMARRDTQAGVDARGAWRSSAPQPATSMSLSTARVRPHTVHASPAMRPISSTLLKSPGLEMGKTRLDDVDVHADELARDDELLPRCSCSRRGDCSPSRSRGIEDVDLAGHGSSCLSWAGSPRRALRSRRRIAYVRYIRRSTPSRCALLVGLDTRWGASKGRIIRAGRSTLARTSA